MKPTTMNTAASAHRAIQTGRTQVLGSIGARAYGELAPTASDRLDSPLRRVSSSRASDDLNDCVRRKQHDRDPRGRPGIREQRWPLEYGREGVLNLLGRDIETRQGQ